MPEQQLLDPSGWADVIDVIRATALLWLNYATVIATIVIGVVFLVIGILMFLERPSWDIAIGLIFGVGVIMLIPLLFFDLLSIPWAYILCGVVGMVFGIRAIAYFSSPDASGGFNIGSSKIPQEDAVPILISSILFIGGVVTTTVGILGLFDYIVVQYARPFALTLSSVSVAVKSVFGLIIVICWFCISVWLILRGRFLQESSWRYLVD